MVSPDSMRMANDLRILASCHLYNLPWGARVLTAHICQQSLRIVRNLLALRQENFFFLILGEHVTWREQKKQANGSGTLGNVQLSPAYWLSMS